MLSSKLTDFTTYRRRMNERILATGTLETRRFFALDDRAYEAGALPAPIKELLGLVASAVLRCDDCITHHLITASHRGVSRDQLIEALDIALIVGGSIVIPHLRRAYEVLDELHPEDGEAGGGTEAGEP